MGCAATVKAAAGAAAALLAAAGARALAPLVADGLPRARAAAAAWLTPPYLYLVINAIIISIAASSRFQPGAGRGPPAHAHAYASSPAAAGVVAVADEPEEEEAVVAVDPVATVRVPEVPAVAVPAVEVPPAAEAALVEAEEPVVEVNAAPAPAVSEQEVEEEFSISRSAWTPRRRGADPEVEPDAESELAPFADLTNSREKPLPSASRRFGRKAAKPSPEGSRALRVARPRKEETLESTWKAITEGRAPPLARHLKKSDTWDARPGRRPSGGGSGEVDPADAAAPGAAMRKAETFNDGRSKPAAPVRREPSLGQDELNRRVEAFIHKFNMEMRLQRQESLKHYNDMMLARGSGQY